MPAGSQWEKRTATLRVKAPRGGTKRSWVIGRHPREAPRPAHEPARQAATRALFRAFARRHIGRLGGAREAGIRVGDALAARVGAAYRLIDLGADLGCGLGKNDGTVAVGRRRRSREP